jgi:hypothetical protein
MIGQIKVKKRTFHLGKLALRDAQAVVTRASSLPLYKKRIPELVTKLKEQVYNAGNAKKNDSNHLL